MAAFLKGFIGGYEGAPYEVKKTYDDGLEERVYQDGYKWVCTKRASDDETENSQFFTLFNYITGENEDKRKIAMTVPVSTYVAKGPDGSITSQEMCFFIGEEHQKDPPKPTNPNVFIKTRPEMTILTRKVGGWVKDRQWEEEAAEVKKMIEAKGIKVEENGYYKNGYDAPMKFINRRNEVWWVKKED